MAMSLDRKITKALKVLSGKVQEQKVTEIEKQRLELEKLKAAAQIELQKQKQEVDKQKIELEAVKANAVLELQKEKQQADTDHAKAELEQAKLRDAYEQKLKEQEMQFKHKQEEDQRDIELRRMANQKDLQQQRQDLEGRLQELKIQGNEQGQVRHEKEGETKVKFPKLTLPKFSGNLLRWKEFWKIIKKFRINTLI